MPNICFSFMCQALTLLSLSYAVFHLIVTKPHKADRFVIAMFLGREVEMLRCRELLGDLEQVAGFLRALPCSSLKQRH